ncbi:MAG: 6-carboxytetrahydropterin synthase [Acidobacteriota bacterium]|nr:6-carboxytetrahydropterin synthase [Acidobacteriota bacterium]
MPSYELKVLGRFEAAHHLTAYRGSAEPVHGHSWRVEVTIRAVELGPEDYVVDFVEVKSALDDLTGRFHHADINSVSPFDALSPTTENLARWFCEELSLRFPAVEVAAVTVWEGPHCAATYLSE